MYGVDVLLEEHKRILEFTDLIKRICCHILEGKEVDTQLLKECIDFGRNYADIHHHGKEEKILFRYMIEKLGPVAEKLVRNGMLVEHDLGRYHLGEWEKAIEQYEAEAKTEYKLAIITNASGYADLLKRHAAKEDAVCYAFALRMLSDEDKERINQETEQFEQEKAKVIQEKYLVWLNTQME
ncbi:MAG: hemerythrin domain-containing protein [Lachnospiraceae bacterium]|nr:hemerythrin domain-containing protein [Lachnospiraceae bacterium]